VNASDNIAVIGLEGDPVVYSEQGNELEERERFL
jgi:hypothetical protein